jgi:hypothetical protein
MHFCARAPGKNWGLAMWPSGMASGGSGQNSGEELAGEGRGRVEDSPGLTTGRFGVEVGAEGRPAAGFRGAIPCRSWERLLWRGRSHAGDWMRSVGYSRCKERWRESRLSVQQAGTRARRGCLQWRRRAARRPAHGSRRPL